MKFKYILLIGLLSALMVLAGCSKPIAGQAIGSSCESDSECDRGETCSRGVCTDTAYEEESESAGEESSSDLSDESGYGASQCTDSDNGKDFLTTGTVNVYGETHEDTCHTFSDGSVYLFEAVCANPRYGNDPWYYVQKKCEEGSDAQGMEKGAYVCGEGKCGKDPLVGKSSTVDDSCIPDTISCEGTATVYNTKESCLGKKQPYKFDCAVGLKSNYTGNPWSCKQVNYQNSSCVDACTSGEEALICTQGSSTIKRFVCNQYLKANIPNWEWVYKDSNQNGCLKGTTCTKMKVYIDADYYPNSACI